VWSVKIHHSSFNLLHSLGEGGLGVAVTRLAPASPPLTPSLRAETAVGRELILVSGSHRPTFAATSRVVPPVGAGRHAAGWTDGFLSEWSEITLILGTLNIGFPGFSEVINSSAPSRIAAQRFRASAAATPWAEAKARASFPKASLNGSS